STKSAVSARCRSRAMTRTRRRAPDLDLLRAALGRTTRGDLLVTLGRAVERLAPEALDEVLAGYFALEDFAPGAVTSTKLLAEVAGFCKRARDGDYYESFGVNSKNFMDKSEGTEAFMEDLDRRYARCIRAAESAPDRATR